MPFATTGTSPDILINCSIKYDIIMKKGSAGFIVTRDGFVRNAIMRGSASSFNLIQFYIHGDFMIYAKSFLMIIRYLERVGQALTLLPKEETIMKAESKVEGKGEDSGKCI